MPAPPRGASRARVCDSWSVIMDSNARSKQESTILTDVHKQPNVHVSGEQWRSFPTSGIARSEPRLLRRGWAPRTAAASSGQGPRAWESAQNVYTVSELLPTRYSVITRETRGAPLQGGPAGRCPEASTYPRHTKETLVEMQKGGRN
ncbi:hypothetical protein HJG60_008427 [Phyllostomus discolor]|uniref:Uncharacterized protein n=1 Tax=Phyllostomus discolor TaxID=89673 RepID=A0A833Z055_9CHIR|nr:hypothetical protein HJG60_008427 [Phyllostomus discolor]